MLREQILLKYTVFNGNVISYICSRNSYTKKKKNDITNIWQLSNYPSDGNSASVVLDIKLCFVFYPAGNYYMFKVNNKNTRTR